MIIYFATWEGHYEALDAVPGPPHTGILTSYFYLREAPDLFDILTAAKGRGVSIFLDSGAYSAYNTGKTVRVEEYAAYYHEHRDLFDVVAPLDVIGDARGTARNVDRLRAVEANARMARGVLLRAAEEIVVPE